MVMVFGKLNYMLGIGLGGRKKRVLVLFWM